MMTPRLTPSDLQWKEKYLKIPDDVILLLTGEDVGQLGKRI